MQAVYWLAAGIPAAMLATFAGVLVWYVAGARDDAKKS